MPIFFLLTTLLLTTPPNDEATPTESARIVDLRTGQDVTPTALARELARYDVVFLGELHDNADGHWLHHELLGFVQQERADVVLSLEMFERDVQGVLDDHLAGRTDEATFLKHARPWDRHGEFYRPFLEFAREKHLDVIAGNVPRAIAGKVAKGEEPSLAERAYLPRTMSAPEGRYRELFAAVMGDHAGTDDPGALDRYFRSQCLKDDAMAEAITDYLTAHSQRSPLVVHVCGSFHADEGRGTVERVLARSPLLRTAVVSMEAVEKPVEFDPTTAKDRAHWLIVVPAPVETNSEDRPRDTKSS